MTENDEQWRPVVGFEDHYQVSDLGRVRSLHRVIVRSNGRKIRLRPHMLTPTPQTDGRLKVRWTGRTFRVHLLVLEAFVGPRPDGHVACHSDDVYTNNTLSNLRWDLPAANYEDQKRNGKSGKRDICSRGHQRRHPNLTPNSACKACADGHTSAFHAINRPLLAELGKDALVAQEAERHYQRIMKGQPEAN